MFCPHHNLFETPGPHNRPLEVRTQTQGNPKELNHLPSKFGCHCSLVQNPELDSMRRHDLKEAAGCNELIRVLPNAVLLIRCKQGKTYSEGKWPCADHRKDKAVIRSWGTIPQNEASRLRFHLTFLNSDRWENNALFVIHAVRILFLTALTNGLILFCPVRPKFSPYPNLHA